MKRFLLLYGIVGGLLITLLKTVEYRFLVLEHSLEMYGALVAVIFVSLGLWLGRRLTTAPNAAPATTQTSGHAAPVALNAEQREALGITKRELEILRLMANGLSNREIATALFVSENTVKTHSSRLFEKLGARRRTQAVQIATQHGLLLDSGHPNV